MQPYPYFVKLLFPELQTVTCHKETTFTIVTKACSPRKWTKDDKKIKNKRSGIEALIMPEKEKKKQARIGFVRMLFFYLKCAMKQEI